MCPFRKLDINKQCVLLEKTRHQYTMCPFGEIYTSINLEN